MPEKVLLVMAEDSASGKPVAGALNLIGSHALFGRNWGCMYGTAIKNLHFELCYYQVSRPFMRLTAKRGQGEVWLCIQHLLLLVYHYCKNVGVVLHIRLAPCSIQACYATCFYVGSDTTQV